MKRTTFREINVTYLALLIGQLGIGAIVVFFIYNGNPVDGGTPAPYSFSMVIPALFVGGLGVAYFLDNQRKTQAATLNFDLPRKLNHYKISVLLRSAIIEGVNLCAAIVALVGGNISYMLYFAVGLLVFLYYRPSKDAFINRYKISASETAQIG